MNMGAETANTQHGGAEFDNRINPQENLPQPEKKGKRPKVLEQFTEDELLESKRPAELINGSLPTHELVVESVVDISDKVVDLGTRVVERRKDISEPDRRVLVGVKSVISETNKKKRAISLEISVAKTQTKELARQVGKLKEIDDQESKNLSAIATLLHDPNENVPVELVKEVKQKNSANRKEVEEAIKVKRERLQQLRKTKLSEKGQISTTKAAVTELATRWEVFGMAGLVNRLVKAEGLRDVVTQKETEVVELKAGEVAIAQRILDFPNRTGVDLIHTSKELNKSRKSIVSERRKKQLEIARKIDNDAPFIIGISSSITGSSVKNEVTDLHKDEETRLREVRETYESILKTRKDFKEEIAALGTNQEGYTAATEIVTRLTEGLPPHLLSRRMQDQHRLELVRTTRDRWIKFKDSHVDVATVEDVLNIVVTTSRDGRRIFGEQASIEIDTQIAEREVVPVNEEELDNARNAYFRLLIHDVSTLEFSPKTPFQIQELFGDSSAEGLMFGTLRSLFEQGKLHGPNGIYLPASDIVTLLEEALSQLEVPVTMDETTKNALLVSPIPSGKESDLDTIVSLENQYLEIMERNTDKGAKHLNELQKAKKWKRVDPDFPGGYYLDEEAGPINEDEALQEVPGVFDSLVQLEDEIAFIKASLAEIKANGLNNQEDLDRVYALGELLEQRLKFEKSLIGNIKARIVGVQASDLFKRSLTGGIVVAKTAIVAGLVFGATIVAKEAVEYFAGQNVAAAEFIQDQIADKYDLITDNSDQIVELEDKITEVGKRISENQTQIETHQIGIENAQQGVQTLTDQLGERPEKMKELWETIADLQKQLVPSAEASSQAMEPAIQVQNIAGVESGSQGVKDVVTNLSDALKELTYYTDLQDKAPELFDQLNDKILELKTNINLENADTESLREDINDLLEQIEDIKDANVSINEEIVSKGKEAAGYTTKAQGLAKTANIIKASASVVTSMAASAFFLTKAYFTWGRNNKK